MKTGVKVIDAMTKEPVVVSPNEDVLSCAKKMDKHRVGSLLVEDKGVFLGIFTERDLISNVISKGLNSKKIKVKDVMTREDMATILPPEDVYEAILMMSRDGIRRLPVVEGEKIVGLLTYKDIIKITPDLYDVYVEKLKMRFHS